ncbi:S-adenosyl-L-methionine-dependent methyltransferase [Xylariaceae sp. FL0255]|nr:S-adenosyl-L-methionine-dependent methyltransferase [Xylariaceae sp. FL0255]
MPALTKAQRKLAQAAEESFNRTYAAQFGEDRWTTSLYPALAAPTRYAVLVNRFAGAGAGAESSLSLSTESEVATNSTKRSLCRITFPQRKGSDGITTEPASACPLEAYHWITKITTTAAGEGVEGESEVKEDEAAAEPPFRQPESDVSSGQMTHWNLDAASLLAVSILDPQPGDKVLDLCAAPGGKSLAIAQCLLNSPDSASTSSPSAPLISKNSDPFSGGCLHSNEPNAGRNKRLASNLRSYLPETLFTDNQTSSVRVLKFDGAEISQSSPSQPPTQLGTQSHWGSYDKVLLDAPCSSERHVIHSSAKNGILDWRSTTSKNAAKTQSALLLSALRAVRVGGRVLYATCSLSNDENDGVVDKAFELVAKERKKFGVKWDFGVVRAGIEDGSLEREWAERTKHGWLVLPDHPSCGKWGPLFFALLEKVEA